MPHAGRAVRMSYIIASVAGIAFFAMSVGLLGVWPARVLTQQARAMAPEQPLGLTESERRGRAIYAREGCAYCHTQQVRYVHADMVRFGAPTLAWETRLDYPHLWGTRRIGPDLSRAGSTRPDDWHYVHLFSPRAVVPESVMPAYRSLFDGSADRPRQSARDLVSYLQTLGRARELAGVEGEARARAGCNCPHDEMAQMAFDAPLLNASPARTRSVTDAPVLRPDGDISRGRALYAANCSGCHGPRGDGDGEAAPSLLPRPTNLAEHEYSMARLADALWNGVPGTAMQAWRDRSPADLAAIARAVRAFASASEAPRPGNLDSLGQRVYAANCVQCHGVEGRGDGPAAAELDIAPTDFHRQRPSLDHSIRALRNGIGGTRMAAWTGRLTEAELIAVAAYVRGFFEPDEPIGGGGTR